MKSLHMIGQAIAILVGAAIFLTLAWGLTSTKFLTALFNKGGAWRPKRMQKSAYEIEVLGRFSRALLLSFLIAFILLALFPEMGIGASQFAVFCLAALTFVATLILQNFVRFQPPSADEEENNTNEKQHS